MGKDNEPLEEEMNLYSLRVDSECVKGLDCVEGVNYDSAITVGNFDGVHVGHQYLVRDLVEKAKLESLKPVVLSFYPHPIKVLSPAQAPCEINNIEERAQILLSHGVHACFFVKFTKDFAHIRADDFIRKVIHEKLRCKLLLVGYDWRFGYKREGEIELAKELGQELGFQVETVKPYKVNGHIVSSTLIRRLLHTGRLEDASMYLGRNYYIFRKVVRGDGRGSKIGFPTANLEGTDNLCLKEGVYAVMVDGVHLGVANYGYRPTFGGKKKVLEVHIIGKRLDLYGKKIKVEFLNFLREEIKFHSVKELIEQIDKDMSRVLSMYAQV